MEQLSGIDASFLYIETPALHMHTLKVAVVDPAGYEGGYSFERVAEVLAERLHLLPPFRRRIVEIPGELAHPVWIEDPDFHLANHLHRVVAPAPGGERELAAVVSEVAGTPLDRNRPLWEITVVEGLADGRVGFVAKIHHSVADGAVAVALLLNALPVDLLPVPEVPWMPEPVPARRALLRIGLLSILRNLVLFPQLIWRAITGAVAVGRRRKGGGLHPARHFDTPVTRFNRALTPNRVFATATARLADVKRVAKAVDCSINDVFLAMCAGALRGHLAALGELPDMPLVTSIPVGIGGESGPRFWGNRVASIYTQLPLAMEDPIERLHAIRELTQASKEELAARGPEMYQQWSELTPPRPSSWIANLITRHRVADHLRPPINLVTSNVAGPRTELSVFGAQLVSLHSVGPILEGVGLNITAWSYVDSVNFGLLACPEAMPDLWELAQRLPEALDELLRASALAAPPPQASEPPAAPGRTT